MKNYIKQAPVTAAIVAVCLLAWAVTAIQSRSLSGSYYDSSLAYAWTLWGPEFAAAPATAITAGFMHIDVGHLTLNMCLLVFIGREIEQALGHALYAASYVVSVLGASAAVLWMDYDAPTVGASGALYALLAMLVGVYRSRGMDLRAPIFLVLANVVYTFIMSGVSLWGHLGGLLIGIVLTLFLFSRRKAVHWIGVAAVFGVVGVLLALRAGLWG
ncbi:rhomboid family intramembrane serine protease [Corynebacterium striatum]|uniref:rhomboid family intramembrane serine protease n=1 Tax=Corynebacterium striatum TaxID=43770 RepID=UPI001FC82344|nr:rhomboid family intramembrane serine protease [Corynebacterium striatum]GKH15716.1 rhomboid family intramembrane serine protease [Corynebacterium striatum]